MGRLAVVSQITGLARSTINRGEDDLDAAPLPKGRVRREGGGPEAAQRDATRRLVADLQRLVEPATLGDPMRPLLWVSKSLDKLAAALRDGRPRGQRQHRCASCWSKLGYSRQVNRKTHEGASHPDRNAQFEHINAKVDRRAGGRAAGDLRRHEEEGAGRQLQERRHATIGPRAIRSA